MLHVPVPRLGRLAVTVEMDVKTGHKFPTSFPSRRAWIHLRVADGQGQEIFESGAPLADGRIAGNDADQQPAKFEPHYRTITSPDEVQIYEAVMEDTEGRVTYALLRAARYAKDNRLLPPGFAKPTAPADAAVVGQAAKDGDFQGGSERVHYRIDLGPAEGPYQVTAELLFQTVSYPFVESLRHHGGPEVSRFLAFYSAADRAPVVIARCVQQIR